MACDVVWTDRAREDLDRAVRYIVENLGAPAAAGTLLEEFEKAVKELARFPEAYAIREHPALHSRNLRLKPVRGYVMLYYCDDELVTIYRIFHSLQNYARIIDQSLTV